MSEEQINYTPLSNLTPLAVVLIDPKTNKKTIWPKCDNPVWIDSNKQEEITLATEKYGVPIWTPQIFCGVINLPDDRTLDIIVPTVVAEYMNSTFFPWVGGIFSPDTGPTSVIRDEKGTIIAVQRLCMHT